MNPEDLFLFPACVVPRTEQETAYGEFESFVLCIIAFHRDRDTSLTSYITGTRWLFNSTKGRGLSFHLTCIICKLSTQCNQLCVQPLQCTERDRQLQEVIHPVNHTDLYSDESITTWLCIFFHRPRKKPRWLAEVGYLRSINHIPKVLETL